MQVKKKKKQQQNRILLLKKNYANHIIYERNVMGESVLCRQQIPVIIFFSFDWLWQC